MSGFGFLAIFIGLVLVGLVWFVTRRALRLQPKIQAAIAVQNQETEEKPEHGDAVLQVTPGGRVSYVNAIGREWFGLLEGEQPNLERLARRVRPSEAFWELCVNQVQARFSLGGRLVEGVSYRIPGIEPVMLVSLRQTELTTGLSDAGDISDSVLRIITDFGRTVAEQLNLEATLIALMENIEKLVSFNILEIKVFDEVSQSFVSYRFNTEEGQAHLIHSSDTRFGNYSAYIAEHGETLFVQDTERYRHVRFLDNTDQFSVRSYIGVPLEVGGELIGMIEVGQIDAYAYASEDKNILDLIAGQAAVAIRNALLYENEQRRTRELSSLANLAQVAGSLKYKDQFFAALIRNIHPLFNVNILGFLLYDEDKYTLRGEVPFEGIPAHIVQVYRTELKAGSPGSDLIAAQNSIISADAGSDDRWKALGLNTIAQAASVRESVLMPMVSSGRFLGYLQFSNHVQGVSEFTDTEIHLMSVVANQTATIIDNAALVLQTQQRARRAETLRRVSNLVTSDATLEETIQFSVRELVQLLRADTAAIFLLDDKLGALKAHEASLYGIPQESVDEFSLLYINDPQFRFTVTGSQRPFITGALQNDRRMIDFYRPMSETSGMQSALAVPLIINEHGVGEMLLTSSQPNFFTRYDLEVAKSVAEQIALVFDRSQKVGETDESLRLRVEQLTLFSRVSRELSGSLDLKHLLHVVYEEGLKLTDADCGTVTIFDQDKLREEGEVVGFLAMGCAQGNRLTEIELEAVRSSKAIWVDDTAEEGYPASHEGVRSALVVPIAYQGQTIGLFHVHSTRKSQFDEQTAELVEPLMIQSAITIRNAYRYEEQMRHVALLERRAHTLLSVLDTTSGLELERPLPDSLLMVAEGIRDATGFDVVLISAYDEESGMLRRITGVGMSDENLRELQEREQPLLSVHQLLQPEFRLGNAYYIPANHVPIIPSDLHIVTLESRYSQNRKQNAWNGDDLFVFLLENQYQEPLGMISLDMPRDGFAPDLTIVEALEIFAAQAALIIDTQGHIEDYKEHVSALNAGLKRQQRLLSVSQNDLPILLRKDLEQTITLQNLDLSTERVRAGLRITEAVSRQLDPIGALKALAREMLTHMGMMTAFIAENSSDGPQLISTLGDLPSTVNADALFGQRNPLRVCLQTGNTMLITNLDESDEWRETALLSTLRSKSLITLPIKVEGKTVAAILTVSREPMPRLTEEDREVYYQIARQTSVIFQNIDLLTSARRRLSEVNLLLEFSHKVSDLNASEMLEELLSNAIQVVAAAHAGLVLIWNEGTERLEPAVVQNYVSDSSMAEINYRYGEALPGIVYMNRKAQKVDEVNFARDYTLSPSQLALYRQGTGGRLPISSLIIPIQTGNFCPGVFVLDNFNKAGSFTDEDKALLQSLAQQVALSLQNIDLVQATEERATQLESLTKISASMSANLRIDDLLPSILNQLAKIIDYDRATLWIYKAGDLISVDARGYAENDTRVGIAIPAREGIAIQEILDTGQLISVPDIRDDNRFRLLGDAGDYFSWLGIPLLFNDEVLGLMELEKEDVGFYDLARIQIGATFASQAAAALENARLFQDSQDRAAELNLLTENLENRVIERTAELEREQRNTQTLLDILTEVSASLDLDLALNRTLALLNGTVGADQGTVMLLNPEDNKLHYRTGNGYLSDDDKRDREVTLRVGEGLAGWVVKQRKAVLVPDLDNDDRWKHQKTDLERHRSAVAAPLMVGEDVIGVLLVFNRQPHFFDPEQLGLIQVIAGQVAVAINNANLYKLIREQAERLGSMLRNEQEEASRSQAILEAVADGVLVTDAQNRISFMNASAENILGIKSEKVINQTLNEFSGLFGKAANIWHEIIHGWYETPNESSMGDSYAEQLELDDGRVVLVHLAPVLLQEDQFLGTVSIFRDITHQVEVDRLKSEFVATVSHELRTPMTSIRGYVDILLMGAAGALSENQTHFLEIIRNNTERLNVLVADLLDVSRLEAGKVNLTLQEVDLKEIAEDVVETVKLRSEEEEKSMNFSIEVAKELPPVYADPDRLRQIVTNLVENAYHYTPESGDVTLAISAPNGDNKVQVDIHDTGVGIKLEDQQQVFERFYRGEDPLVLATPGTGLGLPIVKQLVEMQRGEIWVKSPGEHGKGSTFSFTLPAYK